MNSRIGALKRCGVELLQRPPKSAGGLLSSWLCFSQEERVLLTVDDNREVLRAILWSEHCVRTEQMKRICVLIEGFLECSPSPC